jgi:1,4-dihydroxy-6-naphthoate synthase
MNLSLGISPCPNDIFIFYGLMEGKIDLGKYQFDVILNDVEELNQKAKNQQLDVSKLSYHAYAYVSKHYQLLHAGSALGEACGPLLISKHNYTFDDIPDKSIAIPGKWTTANLLLSLAFPTAKNKIEMLFSDIESSVMNDEVDIGLIIHENRFTYKDKGLIKLLDLGEYWEESTGQAIPLGGIVVKRSLPDKVKKDINQFIKSSLAYAYAHESETLEFAKHYAQEMDYDVMRKHINLYVNSFTEDLGLEGRKVIHVLYDKFKVSPDFPILTHPIFI